MALSVGLEIGHNEVVANASTLVITLTSGANIGDMVVSAWASSTPAQSLSSVSDSKGNTWTVRGNAAGSNASIRIAESIITIALSASDTITGSYGSNTSARLASAVVVTGQAVSPHDQAGTNTGSTTTFLSVTAAGNTAQNNEVVFVAYGFGAASGGIPFANNGGYTSIADTGGRVTPATVRGLWFGYKILSTIGTEAASQTANANENYAGTLETYKEVSASFDVKTASSFLTFN